MLVAKSGAASGCRPHRHTPPPPPPRKHATAPPANQRSRDEHVSSKPVKNGVPAYEGAVFDTRGCCLEHPSVQLREKKADGSWRIRRRLCASCLQLNNHKMFTEDRRSKPSRPHGSVSLGRSTCTGSSSHHTRGSEASSETAPVVPRSISTRSASNGRERSRERMSTATRKKPISLEAKFDRNERGVGTSHKSMNAGTIRRSQSRSQPRRNEDKALSASIKSDPYRPSSRSMSRTRREPAADPSVENRPREGNRSQSRSRSVSRHFDSMKASANSIVVAPIKRSVSRTRECVVALKQPAEDGEKSRSRGLRATSIVRRRSRSRGCERSDNSGSKDQAFEESSQDKLEKSKGNRPLSERANAYSESALRNTTKERSRSKTPSAHRAENVQSANRKSRFSRQLERLAPSRLKSFAAGGADSSNVSGNTCISDSSSSPESSPIRRR